MHKFHVVAAVALSCVVIGGDAPYTRVQSPVSATIAARSRCGAKQPDALQQNLIEAQLATFEQRNPGALRDADENVVVPVHFHVITTASGGGNVTGLLAAQMDVLNAAFAPAGFAFTLASQEVVRNDTWFFAAAGSPEEIDMKAKLRVGGTEALNIYTTNGDIYLGWATFPHDAKHFLEYDGVVLYWATLPGTGFEFAVDPASEPDGVITYDQGDTGTHEIGHWLGLYHTFESGCGRNGDRIKDTPAEAEPQFFCAQRDSCSGKKYPGLDPITNFMDYVDDVCMVEFTSDQDRRMGKQWKAYRR